MSEALYRLAVEGDIEGLCDAVSEEEGNDAPEDAIYQWLQVAASLGSKIAAGMAEGLYEVALSQDGDEVVAVLHFEVAEWFIHGENGVAEDHDLGLGQLALAQRFNLRESVDLDDDLRALRAKLSKARQERFAEIFPELEVDN